MNIQFSKDNGFGKILLAWWEKLEDDRADRAILRRASSITAITLTAPYQRIYQRLLKAGWSQDASPSQKDRLAVVIGLLAHVKQNDGRAPALAMSQKEPGQDRPPVSEQRFMRLLESPDLDALFTGLRRALPLAKHSVGVLALANDLLYWGDKVKKDWAYSYEWPDKTKN